jgi:hypothetical protein
MEIRSNYNQVIIASSLLVEEYACWKVEGAKKEKEAECIPNTARQIRIRCVSAFLDRS